MKNYFKNLKEVLLRTVALIMTLLTILVCVLPLITSVIAENYWYLTIYISYPFVVAFANMYFDFLTPSCKNEDDTLLQGYIDKLKNTTK